MTITFDLARAQPEDVAFAYSPILEAILSLHVLVDPKHHPLQHPFVRDMQGLPARLRRDIERFAFVYAGYFPAFFFPQAGGSAGDFERELDLLADVPAALARVEYTQMLVSGDTDRDPDRRTTPAVAAAIRANAAAREFDDQLVELALVDPARLHASFLDFLGGYWRAAFAREWERTEPVLANAIADVGRRLVHEDLIAILMPLWPAVRCDPARRTLSLDRTHQHTVEVSAERRLTLSPSAFVWPHVRANCDDPWPLAVAFPVLALLDNPRDRLPPNELIESLKALAHDVRLHALRLIAERPRSTQELAALVDMSEAALNRHLRHLAAAGLLRTERDGRYVLYAVQPRAVERVRGALGDFLLQRDQQSR